MKMRGAAWDVQFRPKERSGLEIPKRKLVNISKKSAYHLLSFQLAENLGRYRTKYNLAIN